MTSVLDASAVLAYLHEEPGAEMVASVLEESLVSTVNWSEVLQKSLWREADIKGMQEEFEEVGVTFKPFTTSQAELAAALWEPTKGHGLSLADRACLALAIESEATVLTADKAWDKLDLGIKFQFLR